MSKKIVTAASRVQGVDEPAQERDKSKTQEQLRDRINVMGQDKGKAKEMPKELERNRAMQ